MSNEAPLLALYNLSAQFRPEIERLGGRLLKVVFEWEGRTIIYNHDEKEFPNPPEPERVMSVPPPLPTGIPRAAPPPPPPAPAPAVIAPPPRAQVVMVDGYELPIPPVAIVDPVEKSHSKRTDPFDGITPLTDEDICPIGKKYPNTKLKDIPADYLDWLVGQPWLKQKQPRLWAYIMRHEDVIAKELKRTGRA